MKTIAAILLSLLISISATPVSVPKTDNCCIKHSCKKEKKTNKETSVPCNPFLSCVCCGYIFPKGNAVVKYAGIGNKEYSQLKNSAIFAGYILSCWHPPENS